MAIGCRVYEGLGSAMFALAAAGPVSLDDLVDLETGRPSELWGWLEATRADALVQQASASGPGWFELASAEQRDRAVADAGPADWQWLLARPHLVAAVLANARRAAEERRIEASARLFAGVLLNVGPEALPGGDRAWVDLVVECVRRFRFVRWLDDEILGRAIVLAVARGDRPAQAVLWGSRGFFAAKTRRMTEAQEYLDRALDLARNLDNPAVSLEVHLHAAYGQILDGRAPEAVATFERFLGDVPEDALPLPPELAPPLDPLPEIAFAVLGNAYAQIGQLGRGLDLLHRLRAAGARVARPELVALADALLCGLHAGRRDFEPARAHAEAAFQYLKTNRTVPYFLWSASIALAWARMTEGRLADVPDILATGQEARVESGLPYFAGSALFEVLDRLDVEGVPPPPGLDIETEIDRVLGWNDHYMPAVAHRYRARRLARRTVDAGLASEIGRHFARSVEILRHSRASVPEFARALADAAQWAEQRGDRAEAARMRAEAHEVFASIGLEPAAEAGGRVDLTAAFLELGRLGSHADTDVGTWGDLAARLCATLGAERCALLEDAEDGVRATAARGGGAAWRAAVQALVATHRPEEALSLDPPAADDAPAPRGQLLVVPFAAARLGRRGWAVIENRHSQALVSAADRRVLDLLGVQLGILTENLTIWNELVSARQRLEHENQYYRQSSPAPAAGGRIVGDSPALRRTLDLVTRVGRAPTAVLIQGETGVGKELIAREVHRQSPRANGPFIAVHIASLAPGLVASSLFGHERGAFTGATEQTRGRFELADGGSLFLDEVGELAPEDQVRLLRVLQEGMFERVGGTRPLRSDYRLIAATNRDLAAEVREGRFREDLFYRLAAFPIVVPPLRERREEIPTLALYFMEAVNRKLAMRFEGIGEADMTRLLAHPWPGNVRELEHVIERAALLSEPPRLRIPPLQDTIDGEPGREDDLGTLEDAERRYLRAIIERTSGRVSGPDGAATRAGLKPSTFNWRVDKLGLRGELKRARAQA